MAEELAGIPWNWIAIRATGLTAWGLLTAVTVWGLVSRQRIASGAPAPRAVSLHRWLGTLSLMLVAIHMGLLLVDPVVPFTFAEILIPFIAPWHPLEVALGVAAFWLLGAAWLAGRLRRRLSDRAFRWVHRGAYAVWPLATMHYVLAGTDALASWSLGLLIAGTALVALALLNLGRLSRTSPTPATRVERQHNLPAP